MGSKIASFLNTHMGEIHIYSNMELSYLYLFPLISMGCKFRAAIEDNKGIRAFLLFSLTKLGSIVSVLSQFIQTKASGKVMALSEVSSSPFLNQMTPAGSHRFGPCLEYFWGPLSDRSDHSMTTRESLCHRKRKRVFPYNSASLTSRPQKASD